MSPWKNKGMGKLSPLEEALIAWRALGDDQRAYILGQIDQRARELFMTGPSAWAAWDATQALLRAASSSAT